MKKYYAAFSGVPLEYGGEELWWLLFVFTSKKLRERWLDENQWNPELQATVAKAMNKKDIEKLLGQERFSRRKANIWTVACTDIPIHEMLETRPFVQISRIRHTFYSGEREYERFVRRDYRYLRPEMSACQGLKIFLN